MVIPTTFPPVRGLPHAEARAQLRTHFTSYTSTDYATGWAKLWEAGDFLPWDRGRPSPALICTLDNYRHVLGGAVFEGTRKKALVPGCGRGVDVLLLAAYGYDVVGLEISPEAVRACEEFRRVEGDKEVYGVRDESVGKGSVKFVLGDFYADEWKEVVGMRSDERFDLIYDYTVSLHSHLWLTLWRLNRVV
jgi:methyl halide transferase